MNLIYGIKDKPKFGEVVLFALQQLLAIMAATIAVPAVVGNGMTASAALFGAGVGSIVYLLFTKSASPVFLGSSFAFIGSMFSAFGGAASVSIGYAGLIIGALMAGLVYVIIAIVVKFCGVKWIDKLMPPVSCFGGGKRTEKKQTVIDKLKGFFERFFGIGGSFKSDIKCDIQQSSVVKDDSESKKGIYDFNRSLD